ncbi:hypothetical protein FCV82_02220 [Vibrio breoganii]|uniref:hypothetical protein n=1 Tax=Vibrio breoganii TaxID=553239 RepID=UPI000C8232CE|nr:hypothetical protein [Vibrio breoganii]PMN67112.1 hypothetical protein BCT28_03925 [Vibrio breoganii]PMO82911.1 hypothetical protein BCT00_06675 [Vibrio breoganii]TKF90408.1 hypothetical protein FCV82_02220 [Vibrio breoganii]
MRAIVITLTIFFVLVFASMAAAGGYLIYEEINPQSSAFDVEVKVERDSVTLNLVKATPGLVMFCFGAIGLILMIYRTPTKEVLGYRTEGGGGSGMGFMVRRKVLATERTNIPLPVWWLLSKTNRFERIEENA